MAVAQMSATDSSDCRSPSRNASGCALSSARTPSVCPNETSGMHMREADSAKNFVLLGAPHQVVILPQEERDVRYPERALNQLTNSCQQLFQVENRRGLLGDGIDGLQLPRPLFFQRVQARVLQSDRCLGGEKSQQVDGLRVEMAHAIALTIEHADYFVPHHQRDGDLGTGGLGTAHVTRVFADVGSVNGLLLERSRSRYSLAERDANLVLPFIPANLRADVQLLRLLVEQYNRHIPQMKIVARDRQDALQHLVQIEGGEHSLASIVQDCDSVHTCGHIVTWRGRLLEVPKVT